MGELASRLHQTTQQLTEPARLRARAAGREHRRPTSAILAYAGSPLDWLVGEAVPPIRRRLLFGMCQRLRADGIPLARATFTCVRCTPSSGAPGSSGGRTWKRPSCTIGRDAINEPRFQNSPIRALFEGADGVRQRFDIPTPAGPRVRDLRRPATEGITDYMALPMVFTDGRRHACSWATPPGGFTTEHLMVINDLLPVLQMAIEIRSTAGSHVRCSRPMSASSPASAFCPATSRAAAVRPFARRSGPATCAASRRFPTWPRDEVIGSLNDYFDTMAAPVENHGGEILNSSATPCWRSSRSRTPRPGPRARGGPRGARGHAGLNDRRRRAGAEIGYGIALHVGDVMYGNIGSAAPGLHRHRPRGQCRGTPRSLSKDLSRHVLLSCTFAFHCGCNAEFLASLGHLSAARCRRGARGVRAGGGGVSRRQSVLSVGRCRPAFPFSAKNATTIAARSDGLVNLIGDI